MSLYYRLKRRLGYDHTEVFNTTRPIYKYTVTHLNGEESTVRASGYKTDGAFLRFYRYTEPQIILGLGEGIWPDTEQHRVLDGVQEVEKEELGYTEHIAKVDLADGTVLEKEWDSWELVE